jgi:hypothetical protein
VNGNITGWDVQGATLDVSGTFHHNPYSKSRFGWVDPVVIMEPGWYSLASMETSGQVLRVQRNNDEYFLLENRWRPGTYDAPSNLVTSIPGMPGSDDVLIGKRSSGLPDQGLAIWHVDRTRGFTAPPFLAREDSNVPTSNDGLWDDTSGDFDDTTPANSRWNDGTASDIVITKISAAGPIIYFYVDFTGVRRDELEPNDSREFPTDLGSGDVRRDNLSIHRDNDDYFMWTAPASGTAVFDLLFSHAQGDLDFILYDQDGTELGSGMSAIDNEQIVKNVTAGRRYILRVYGFDHAVNPNHEIAINGPDAPPDRFEPNDSFDTAVTLKAGNHVESGLSIHSHGNDDYYRWVAPQSGTLDVHVGFQHAEGDLDVELYDDGRNLIASSRTTTNGEHITDIDVAGGRSYYIRVFGFDDAINRDYSLEVVGPAIPSDGWEANDDFDSASPLSLGDSFFRSVSIHAPNNQDYYSWTASEDGLLIVDLLFEHAQGDLELYLYDAQRNLLQESRSSSDNERVFTNVTAGESYFVRVRGAFGELYPDYALSIDGPDVLKDRFEDNNTFETAIDLGSADRQETHLSIHSVEHGDWYKWTAPASGLLNVHVDFAHAEGDLDVVIYDAQRKNGDVSTGSSDREEVSAYVAFGQTYYLHVYGYNGALNRDYTLTLDGPEAPGPLIVNTLDDVSYLDDQLTLREAVMLANAQPGADRITFQPTLAGQTITLQVQLQRDTPILIADELTIDASMLLHGITVDGNSQSRIFEIPQTIVGNPPIRRVTFDSLTLRGGNAVGDGGGAIRSFAAETQIIRTTVTRNFASTGGGVWAENGNLIVLDSLFTDNVAEEVGGGVFYLTTGLTSLMTVVNSTFADNVAEAAGAIFSNGNIAIINSTVWKNTATGSQNTEPSGGILAAINLTQQQRRIYNSIIAGNTGTDDLWIGNPTEGPPDIRNSMIGVDTGSSLLPTDPDGDGVHQVDAHGNLVGSSAKHLDPLLAELADNGGPTLTHALKPGSPAIDHGNNPLMLAFDQRGTGFARTSGLTTDMGAFEVQVPEGPPMAEAGGDNGIYEVNEGGTVVLDGSGSSDPNQPADSLTYEWDLDNDGQFDDATGTTAIFDAAAIDGRPNVTKTVKLRVTDNKDNSSIDTATINIVNVAPDVTLSSTSTGGGSLTLHGLLADIPVDAQTVLIDWGDGQQEEPPKLLAGTTEFQFTHAYTGVTTDGYNITVTVTDDGGQTVVATQLWWQDVDGDGDGGGKAAITESKGDGFVRPNGDCDDGNPTIHPGAAEIADNDVDENCDGVFGFGVPAGPGQTAQSVTIGVNSQGKLVLRGDFTGEEIDLSQVPSPLRLKIEGSATQTDSLNVNIADLPAGTEIEFDAKGGGEDAVHIVNAGGATQTFDHNTPTGTDGYNGTWTGGGVVVRFKNIKPLTSLNSSSTEITVNLPPVTDHAVLQRLIDGNGRFHVLSPSNTFEKTLVEIPSQMFMLNAGDGDDMIELLDDTGQSLDSPVMVHGDEGNDTFDVRQFPHLVQLFGDDGDDVFQFATPMFEKLDGGDGMDIVELVGADTTLDVAALADDQLVGIERLDIRGSGKNLLRLSADKVQALVGDGGALEVWADEDDTVELGSGWQVTGVEVRDGRFYRILQQTAGGSAIVRSHGPRDWQNPLLNLDVNLDGEISPIDSLIIINELNDPHYVVADLRLLDAKTVEEFPMFFFDVNGDGFATPLDVLLGFNFLNRDQATEGELVGGLDNPAPTPQMAGSERLAHELEKETPFAWLPTSPQQPIAARQLDDNSRISIRDAVQRAENVYPGAWPSSEATDLRDRLFRDAVVDELWELTPRDDVFNELVEALHDRVLATNRPHLRLGQPSR